MAPEGDSQEKLPWALVGAGPTGVEMAGQIAELADHTLKGAFRHIDSTKARVILLDAAPAVLPPMGEKLGQKAAARLEKLGVEIQLGAMVTDVDRNGITVKHGDGTIDRIECATKVWSAGVSASPLGKQIADQSGAEKYTTEVVLRPYRGELTLLDSRKDGRHAISMHLVLVHHGQILVHHAPRFPILSETVLRKTGGPWKFTKLS